MSQLWEQRLLSADLQNVDYADALWSPAANLLRPRQRTIRYIIIHITGGPSLTEQAALNTFHHGPASAHYIVNREGRVVQMVNNNHIANHVDNIHSRSNRESIGIEHVNPWSQGTHMYPTDAQYAASARLVGWLCRQYSIPVVHNPVRHGPGIRGHIEEAPHSNHRNCPNPAWDWDRYIQLVENNPGETVEDISRDLMSYMLSN